MQQCITPRDSETTSCFLEDNIAIGFSATIANVAVSIEVANLCETEALAALPKILIEAEDTPLIREDLCWRNVLGFGRNQDELGSWLVGMWPRETTSEEMKLSFLDSDDN
jgi:hypothetical protein